MTTTTNAQQGRTNRRRGGDAERELAKLLAERLGIAVSRNLQQTRDGGYDLLLTGWSLEVKRAVARSRLADWWRQTVQQAEQAKRKPALAYRLDRRPWRVIVALADVMPTAGGQSPDLTAELCIDGFALLVRELL